MPCDLSIDSDALALEVASGANVTLDLDGHDLSVTGYSGRAALGVPETASLTITDSSPDGAGTLTASSEADAAAGIGGGGDVTITGGTVMATGGVDAAGIGGSHGDGAGSPPVAGGSFAIVAPAVVTVSGATDMAIGGPSDLGLVSNSGTLRLPAGESVDLKGGTLENAGTFENSGAITGSGTISGDGTIGNSGSISQQTQVLGTQTVLDHHAAAPLYAYPSGAASDPSACSAVATLQDACTLQQAIDLAADGDTVILAADPDSSATFITHTGWVIEQDSLSIHADTGLTPVLDGLEVAPYVFDFLGGGALNVDGVTILGSTGSADTSNPGGGIIVRHGDLVVSDSSFVGNSTDAGYGGGVVLWTAQTSATVTRSTFAYNDATGASTFGGGITSLAGGDVTVSASTFVGNDDGGGGIFLDSGTLTITASTFVGNRDGVAAGPGAGVFVASSIFAGNDVHDCWLAGDSSIDGGYNIDSDGSCVDGGVGSVADVPQLAGLLNELGDNGGYTETIAPKPGSPAAGVIPAGTVVPYGGGDVELCPALDQRGVQSPAGEPCNIGSVQDVVGEPLALTTTALQGGTVGTEYSMMLEATGGSGVHGFAIIGGKLPDGLELTGDGTIGGVPTAAGTFAFTAVVTDANSVSATASMTIDIVPAPPATIEVCGGDGQAAEAGSDFQTPLSALVSDTQAGPASGVDVTFVVTGGDASFDGAPSVVVSTNDDGLAVAPTLTAGQSEGPVTVAATATAVAGSALFNVAVTAAAPELTVLTDKLPTARVGVPYKGQLEATGAADDIYHWSIASGSLPRGWNCPMTG
ncbi:MAG: choice-of-anchor Q domain-containing protein [Cumulibacter sp.]